MPKGQSKRSPVITAKDEAGFVFVLSGEGILLHVDYLGTLKETGENIGE